MAKTPMITVVYVVGKKLEFCQPQIFYQANVYTVHEQSRKTTIAATLSAEEKFMYVCMYVWSSRM